MDLNAKEGIALINGTQFITAFGAECVERGRNDNDDDKNDENDVSDVIHSRQK